MKTIKFVDMERFRLNPELNCRSCHWSGTDLHMRGGEECRYFSENYYDHTKLVECVGGWELVGPMTVKEVVTEAVALAAEYPDWAPEEHLYQSGANKELADRFFEVTEQFTGSAPSVAYLRAFLETL